MLDYVLITPARNEAEHIGETLRSMVAQTRPPLRWVVVSDGSTDGTDELVAGWAARHPWIRLLRMPERQERDFAGKVRAFEAGRREMEGLAFDVLGNLDGDVSFGPGHFAHLLAQMEANPRLGVAGAPFEEGGRHYDYRFSSIENVWGGCQLFRRACYEQIGGYRPVRGGGIDHIAVLSARRLGWQTRTFVESVCVHHRPMGTAVNGLLRARFRLGAKDYAMGNHPLWQMVRAAYQMTRPPLAAGGLALGSGYLWSALRRRPRAVSPELLAFVRREQAARLRRVLSRGSRPVAAPAPGTPSQDPSTRLDAADAAGGSARL